jgi:hypothetical protein
MTKLLLSTFRMTTDQALDHLANGLEVRGIDPDTSDRKALQKRIAELTEANAVAIGLTATNVR